MTSSEPVDERAVPHPGAPPSSVPPAPAIYGLIVAASVLATVGTDLRTGPLILAVVVTLVVYWLAEEYAELVEEAGAGHLPGSARIRAALSRKWPLVSASYVPVVTLGIARLLGASPTTSAVVALIVIMALLTMFGWRAGRASHLHGPYLLVITLSAGGLGLLMILLKFALSNLH